MVMSEVTPDKELTPLRGESGKAVVEIGQLYKSFGDNHVLRGFNLTLREGEHVAVLGQSGSGKSVLIKCVVGLVKPDRGTLRVFGRDVLNMTTRELDELRVGIGFLFQSNALYDSMTVRQNLEFPFRRLNVPKTQEEIDQMVEEALTDVGLLHAIEYMPAQLSGGMRKRVSIARTLIMRPRIMLYDEPTTGLDPITAREIGALMLEVHEKYNTASIIISHDMACIKQTAHRIVMLIDGINYAEGTYSELENSPDHRVHAFFE